MSLALEAVVVGVVLAIALAITVRISGSIDSPGRGLAIGFVLGILVHLGFELSGANAAYCTIGAACLPST
jgi:hypothetical protein